MEGRRETLPELRPEDEGEIIETREELVEETVDDVEEPKDDKADRRESVRETVERAAKELEKQTKGESPGSDDEEKEEPQAEDSGAAPKVKAKQTKGGEEEFDPELSPPERLRAHEKQLFNNLPKGLRRALSRTIKDHEQQFTRTQQEFQAAAREARGVLEAVQPFAAEWGQRGLTTPQAIAALAAAQRKLTDPATKQQAAVELLHDIGLSHLINESAIENQSGGADISQHPYVRKLESQLTSLQQQVQPLYNSHQQRAQQESNVQVAQIVGEIRSVMDEVDPASGKYLYPELHDETYRERVKPLVSALVQTVPGLSWGDAAKRAVLQTRAQQHAGTLGQLNQTKLPASNQQTNRAIAAAGTVRGRSAPQTDGLQMPENIPNSVRDTVRLAYEALQRGRVQ